MIHKKTPKVYFGHSSHGVPRQALTRAEDAAGASAVRQEFERLQSAMETWDSKLSSALEGRLAGDRAEVKSLLERFLGDKGELERTLEGLRRCAARAGWGAGGKWRHAAQSGDGAVPGAW